MYSKMEKKSRGEGNLIVVCHGVSPSESVTEVPLSEGIIYGLQGFKVKNPLLQELII